MLFFKLSWHIRNIKGWNVKVTHNNEEGPFHPLLVSNNLLIGIWLAKGLKWYQPLLPPYKYEWKQYLSFLTVSSIPCFFQSTNNQIIPCNSWAKIVSKLHQYQSRTFALQVETRFINPQDMVRRQSNSSRKRVAPKYTQNLRHQSNGIWDLKHLPLHIQVMIFHLRTKRVGRKELNLTLINTQLAYRNAHQNTTQIFHYLNT